MRCSWQMSHLTRMAWGSGNPHSTTKLKANRTVVVLVFLDWHHPPNPGGMVSV